MWETRISGSKGYFGGRIIPTYVGNTSHSDSYRSQASDHPHIRGKHTLLKSPLPCPSGSSPHTWETPNANLQNSDTVRIIPTYVRNTPHQPSARFRSPDHPHIRGKHLPGKERAAPDLGSSPRMWETLKQLYSVFLTQRIIPT